MLWLAQALLAGLAHAQVRTNKPPFRATTAVLLRDIAPGAAETLSDYALFESAPLLSLRAWQLALEALFTSLS